QAISADVSSVGVRATATTRSAQVIPGEVTRPPVLAIDNAPKPLAPNKAMPAADYGKVPLSFEQNVGQTDSRVEFMVRTSGGTVFLTPTAAVFAMQQSSVSDRHYAGMSSTKLEPQSSSAGVALYMNIVGANPVGRAAGVNKLPGKMNYFIGN